MLSYIITRFSIYDPTVDKWKFTKKNTPSQIKRKLFDTDRLDFKFKVFEKVTIPSVLKQTNQNYVWYIYASEYMPDNYKQQLINLTQGHDKIKCIFITSFKNFNKIDYVPNYCTVRLDDDDGISAIFIEKLNKYSNEKGKIISFTTGTKFTIQNDTIIKSRSKRVDRLNAQGMTAIEMNIYSCGNHAKVNKKFPVIYDKTPNMYLVCCSEYCSTGRAFGALQTPPRLKTRTYYKQLTRV